MYLYYNKVMVGETVQKTHGPGKPVIALGVVVFALIIAAVIFQLPGKTSVQSDDKTGDVFLNENDTDGDGLKDWEEILWGTNPKIADTDGDGLGDLAEKEERAQLVLEEQRTLMASATDMLDTDSPEWQALPYTDKVSQSVLTQYLALKQSGSPVTVSSMLSLLQNIPSYEKPALEVRVYTETDILISNNTGTAALRTYGNDLGSLLVVPEGETPQNELAALHSFVQTGDGAALRESLTDVLQRYDAVISGMRLISVPKDLVEKHLALMNSLSRVQTDLEALRGAGEDPLLALSVVQTYNNDTSERAGAFAAIWDFLVDAGITYAESEPGYLLSGK